jgi:hypothetical protein
MAGSAWVNLPGADRRGFRRTRSISTGAFYGYLVGSGITGLTTRES